MLSVISYGMVTPIGFNGLSSSAAMRAGISGIEDFYLSNAKGSPHLLQCGKVELPQWWDNINKLADLVSPAISECLRNIDDTIHSKIPILLGVALTETQFLSHYDKLFELISQRLGIQISPHSRLVPYGHTSGIASINIANQLLALPNVEYCIIAGVDSYLSQSTISHYLEKERIRNKKNSDGFFPGEAGAAVLVSKNCSSAKLCILSMGEGEEVTTIYTESPPLQAKGMTIAIRQALTKTNITLDKICCRLCDINGEEYKFKEANIALMRFNSKNHQAKHEILHPIEYTGEIGAAIVPLLLGFALSLHNKKSYQSEYMLLHASNDSTHRGALILQYI